MVWYRTLSYYANNNQPPPPPPHCGQIMDHWATVCLFVGFLTSQQHASVSQGRIYSDNCTCCHTEIQVADQTFYLTQSQYTDTRPTSPSADPITPAPGVATGLPINLGHWYDSTWKNLVVSRIRTPDLPLSGRRLNHLANEAVWAVGVVSCRIFISLYVKLKGYRITAHSVSLYYFYIYIFMYFGVCFKARWHLLSG